MLKTNTMDLDRDFYLKKLLVFFSINFFLRKLRDPHRYMPSQDFEPFTS